ncbi:MAG: CoA pyrophosphatase [Salinivirgaceae bacterium]|jgi:8-oxo-dGTP pyrophosphatase MutT (NUDIX family)
MWFFFTNMASTYYIDTFINSLKEKFPKEHSIPLAHQLMMPQGRIMVPDHSNPPLKSAVLLLLFPKQGQLYFPIIRRPVYDGMHSGQMALPGGKQEEIDVTLEQTAVREACEEIGICSSDIRILGHLTELYIAVTNIHVLPVVALAIQEPSFVLDAREVDELFSIPLTDLLNPELKKKELWDLRGQQVEVPFYLLANHKVWGATAMILSEFESIAKGL